MPLNTIGKPERATQNWVIATIFSDMGAEIAALEEKLTKARKVKQGMMQGLLLTFISNKINYQNRDKGG